MPPDHGFFFDASWKMPRDVSCASVFSNVRTDSCHDWLFAGTVVLTSESSVMVQWGPGQPPGDCSSNHSP